MFKNEHKQRMLEKVQNFFFNPIWSKERDAALESLEQEAIYLESYSSKLEQIRSSGRLKEFALQYDGDFQEELRILKQAVSRVKSKALKGWTETVLQFAFSFFAVLTISLLIFLIPAPFFSTKPEHFLPEDQQRDLQQRLNRLEKADYSVWFIRKKKVQYLLEFCWAAIRMKWDDLWLPQNKNAR